MKNPEQYRQQLLSNVRPIETKKVEHLIPEGAKKKDEIDANRAELAVVNGLILPSMRLISEKQVSNHDANLRVRLQFSIAIPSTGANGAAKVAQIADCLGSQAKGWYREKQVIHYELTEAGEEFRDHASVEDLFQAMDCLGTSPSIYYELLQEPEGGK